MRTTHHVAALAPALSALLLCVPLLLFVPQLEAATIAIGSATAAPGQSVPVWVSLSGGDGQISGVQMDLSWDPTCASPDPGQGTAAACTSNPATGKNVHSGFPNSFPNTPLRAVMFSIMNPNPIPDGQLFYCNFTLSTSPSRVCCPILVAGVRGSKARGEPITDISAIPGQVCATSAPPPPPASGPLPQPPVLAQPVEVAPAGQVAPAGSSGETGSGAGAAAPAPVAPAAAAPGVAAAPAAPAAPGAAVPAAPAQAAPVRAAGAAPAGLAVPVQPQLEAPGEPITIESGVSASTPASGQTAVATQKPRPPRSTPTPGARSHQPDRATTPTSLTPVPKHSATAGARTETPKTPIEAQKHSTPEPSTP